MRGAGKRNIYKSQPRSAKDLKDKNRTGTPPQIARCKTKDSEEDRDRARNFNFLREEETKQKVRAKTRNKN